MSVAELLPFFPSATHPALPVAAQILSNLRQLTAPGRGNDLKPEERAALVGVSALLACERLQMKDLVESSAQKASSVAPSHFRSTLAKSRQLLATVVQDSPRKSSRSRTSSAEKPAQSPVANSIGDPAETTPKKRFKYPTGVGVGVASKASPNRPHIGSPLKQSVTPSKPTAGPSVVQERSGLDILTAEGQGEGAEDEDEIETPTKKVKYRDTRSLSIADRPRRAKEDYSAFLALRPGSSSQSNNKGSPAVSAAEAPLPSREELGFVSSRSRRQKTAKRKVKPKRDWSYGESLWGGKILTERNDKVVRKLLRDLPVWCKENEDAGSKRRQVEGETLVDILLPSFRSEPYAEDEARMDLT